ncbi:MAG: hypothetical protein WAN46_10970 [Gammaproteobacteria bacterium]
MCFWFDERQEFVRLLDALDVHLASMTYPPFRLLRYGTENRGSNSLLAERAPRQEAVAYVCQGHQCRAPISDLGELETALASTEHSRP